MTHSLGRPGPPSGEERPRSKRLQIWLLNPARVLLTVAPFVWIFSRLDFTALLQAVVRLPWWVLPVMFGVPVMAMLIQALRWWMLLRRLVPGVALKRTTEVHMAAAFYALAFPGISAQEIVRGLLFSGEADHAAIWSSTWVYKLMGLVGWISIAALGIAAGVDLGLDEQRGLIMPLLVVVAVVVLAVGFSFSKRLSRPSAAVARRLLPGRVYQVASDIRESVYRLRHFPGSLFACYLLTVAVQLFLVFGTTIVVLAISGRMYFGDMAVALSLVELVVIGLPLTPGGIGMREGLMALMFGRLGLTPEHVAVYVALHTVGMCSRLTGGLFVLTGRIPALRLHRRPGKHGD